MTATASQVNKIDSFLSRERGNEWFKYGPLEVYLRVGIRYIQGKKVRTLDIATVNIENEKHRGKGVFKEFLAFIRERVCEWNIKAIYIENVLVPKLANYFRRKGWEEMLSDSEPCFFRYVTAEDIDAYCTKHGISKTEKPLDNPPGST